MFYADYRPEAIKAKHFWIHVYSDGYTEYNEFGYVRTVNFNQITLQ